MTIGAGTTTPGSPLFRLVLDGDAGRVVVAGSAIEETARSLGLSAMEAGRVRILLEGLLVDASDRLDAHVDEPVTVTATIDGTLLRVTVSDQGAPTDHAALPPVVLALLDAGVVEGLRVDPPDARGNRITIDVALPSHRQSVTGDELVDESERAPSEESLEYRRMRPDEALALSRGIHSCYGFSYPDLAYYFPERLAARLASPDWNSYVAVNPAGRIVAHLEQDFTEDGRVVHVGGAFTDPRYRGRNLLLTLAESAVRDRGLRDPAPVVRYSEAVTTHPITQRIGLEEGQIECGIMLAHLPAMRQEGFNDDVAALQRATVRPGLMFIEPPVEREVHAPAFVADYVRRIVDHHELPRTVEVPRPRSLEDAPDHTLRVVEVNREVAAASITVTTVGRDLGDVVAADLQALQRQAVWVELRLPAGDPAVSVAAAGLDEFGFVFCSFLPEFRSTGDELRLQWLPNAEFDAEAIVLHTEFMAGLVADVIADVRRAKDRESEQRRRRASSRRIFAALD
ncbi:MAG: ATP-binding protein [Acidimicrobiia bacterium]|nr:ATP-binding protein [Acidimicrobiia bacterium]